MYAQRQNACASAHRGCSARMSRRRQGRLTWPSVPLLMMRRVDVELVGTAWIHSEDLRPPVLNLPE